MGKVIVNKEACVGCGACVNNCPKYFEFDDDGLSNVKKEEVEKNDTEEVMEAVETCPTGAISIEE